MKRAIALAATGLVAASVSLSGTAWADPTTSPSPSATAPSGPKNYSGYSTSAVATPVKVEIFEPTIPIPTVPQAEFDLGYAKIKGDSSTTRGRASFLWPGDGVGEGLKTFFEQLGLPTAPVEDGYPVQVNSQYPSDTTTQEQKPLPGASMTTTSDKGQARATVGYSTNCDAGDGPTDVPTPSQGGEGGPLPGLPGLPGPPALPSLGDLPGLPELPLLDNLTDLLSLTGLARTAGPTRSFSRTAAADEAAECQLPDLFSALVDVNGYVADTQSVSDDQTVTTTARAALGDVRLLGGLVTLSGGTSTLVTTSDGTTGTSSGRADYGTMTIAGQTFAIGPEGYVAAGAPSPIPGLPDDPAAALEALGITITLPQPAYTAAGDKASGTVEGLVVTIDLKLLKPVLSQLQLGPLLANVPFPPEAAPLKSALSAIGNLSPKVVLHLGYATATVDTVQPLKLPTAAVPDNDPSPSPGADPAPTDTPSANAGGATGGDTGAPGTGSGALPPPADAPAPAPALEPTAAAPVADVALSSGLPDLFSIPGLLMTLGLGGALLAGNYVRRIGALVLGGAGACAHGLESGLPDLRKVQ